MMIDKNEIVKLENELVEAIKISDIMLLTGY